MARPAHNSTSSLGGAGQPNRLAGSFAFRFSGFTMPAGGVLHYIVGLGLMTLKADGTLEGSQRASTTALQGEAQTQQSGTFELSGAYGVDGDLSGHATIK